ncbi:hypothetical protein Acor_50890 [Acrocarpospora corrugata]|uniref:Uncharacterized protein n=1 Tax=Acrocarpospora corrugata TaxID=35763 RepID=A0A5M3W746_9ACTN|nr:hypothetical protein [Acrocarpospora corrugata]GES03023.1 hypothetical protein Acor_50890 [Acrocarpospora corrugata]
MIGRARRRVASIVAATLASSAVVVMIAAAASAANPVEGCPPGETCDSVTITVTNEPTGDVSVTVTQTVTPPPSGAAPSPTVEQPPSNTAPAVPTTQPVPPVLPTSDPVIPTETAQVPEPEVSLPAVGETAAPTPTSGPAFAEPDPEAVAIVIRNANPEFDQTGLSRKLAAPAALLVLLALLGWLVFEGRLRRLAHAAALRRGMMQMPMQQLPMGHPMAGAQMMPYPGYPLQPYQAPVVSYVPVPYPMPYPQQPYGQPPEAQQSYPPPAQAPGYPQGYVIERTIEEPLPGGQQGGTAVFPMQAEPQPGEPEDPRRRRPY